MIQNNLPAPLSKNETLELLEKWISSKDYNARDTIIIHNLWYIAKIIDLKFSNYPNKEELMEIGMHKLVILLDNINDFVPDFTYYLSRNIISQLTMHINSEENLKDLIDNNYIQNQENIIENIENSLLIDEILSYLSDRQRKTFEMYFIGGYQLNEIDKILNWPRNTACISLHSGLHAAKRFIKMKNSIKYYQQLHKDKTPQK